MKKRALLNNPYLDVLGGGEKHVLAIMSVLAEHGFDVDIVWDDATILEKIHSQLRINTSGFKIIPNFFKGDRNTRDQKTAEYDVLLYVTDGSYFQSKAKRNIIFSMYPQKSLYSLYPTNWLKLSNFEVISNGAFTAEKVDGWLHKPSTIIYPFVDQEFFVDKTQKSPIILSVGRIFKQLHSKRQDVLIKAFQKLKSENKEFENFKLIIAGGLKDEDRGYFAELQALANGALDIEFKTNISYQNVVSLYASAKFYWHAAGFGIDESKHPENVEHVGISPLEGMASKCLTICYDAGGPKRYMQNGVTGYTFTSIDDLVQKTVRGYEDILRSEEILENAHSFVSQNFSYPVFKNKVEQFFHI